MLYSSNGFVFKENEHVRNLLSYITNKEIMKGERLPAERELAKQLGIGRNALREALKVLEAMGIVEIRHGSGIFLLKTDLVPGDSSTMWLEIHKDEIYHMITVREALDLKAIELIPEEMYTAVREQLKKSIAAIKKTELTNRDLLQHDLEFHNIIRAASGNDILLNICAVLTGTIYDERKVLFSNRDYVERSLQEHMEIANAFGSGDINQIKQAYAAHLATTRSGIEFLSLHE